MEKSDKILLILTGGTICSFVDETNTKRTDVARAETVITSRFHSSMSKYAKAVFDTKMPLNILSENMTVSAWNTFITKMKQYNIESYKGVIILHGTDTLSYTSALLSVLFAGVTVPIFLVSSQKPLTEYGANGHDNFRLSVSCINEGIAPNVYVPYKNSDGVMRLHLGAHLLACENFSDDFYSRDACVISDLDAPNVKGVLPRTDAPLYKSLSKLVPSVIKITPYTGLSYRRINLRKIKAVVHGTYHSQTLCVGEKTDEYSVLYLKECFKQKNFVPLFITPCKCEKDDKNSFYSSTKEAVDKGGISVWGMTDEMVYVKALVGASLGYRCDKLVDFVKYTCVAGEFHF